MIHDSLEQTIGITAACIPAIKPLFRSKRSAKNPARHLEDPRPLHRHLNISMPSSLFARTADDSAGTHQTENEPNSFFQSDEIGLESADGRSDNMEIGLPQTVHISHERILDSIPGMWSAVSQPQDDRKASNHALVLPGA